MFVFYLKLTKTFNCSLISNFTATKHVRWQEAPWPWKPQGYLVLPAQSTQHWFLFVVSWAVLLYFCVCVWEILLLLLLSVRQKPKFDWQVFQLCQVKQNRQNLPMPNDTAWNTSAPTWQLYRSRGRTVLRAEVEGVLKRYMAMAGT